MLNELYAIFVLALFIYVVVALCKKGRAATAERNELRQRQLRDLRQKQGVSRLVLRRR